ncbi:hypothetical protein BAU28_19555 [Bacillus paramycoides]|uniref:Permease n=1 Tax=Bacillus paramycoides TaxID=2026194 RepID=A0A1J9TZM6_9BACI|nr:hypothetical protein BAU28_19555 [Bacillus paramycoides]
MNIKRRILFTTIRYLCWSIGLAILTFNDGDSILSTLFFLLGIITIYIEDYALDHRKNLKKQYKEILPIAIIILILFIPMTKGLKISFFLLLLTISYFLSLQQIFKEKRL